MGPAVRLCGHGKKRTSMNVKMILQGALLGAGVGGIGGAFVSVIRSSASLDSVKPKHPLRYFDSDGELVSLVNNLGTQINDPGTLAELKKSLNRLIALYEMSKSAKSQPLFIASADHHAQDAQRALKILEQSSDATPDDTQLRDLLQDIDKMVQNYQYNINANVQYKMNK